jgi:glucose 1-dehydrogenase
VVTGAAGGIGSRTCALLEDRGWTVVPMDRRPIDHPRAIQVDMADAVSLERELAALKRVDGLVNNAALQLYKTMPEITVAEWDEVSAVNLRGPFVAMRTLRDHLIESGGAVVNVASVHAHATSLSISAYAASKGGLVALTRAAALEFAPTGVRVNAVLPGAVDTPALRDGLSRSPDAEATLLERIPMRRIGDPREIAEVVEFLLDRDRAGYITGACIPIDGGALARLGTE